MTGLRLCISLVALASLTAACSGSSDSPDVGASPWLTLAVQVDENAPVEVLLPRSAVGSSLGALAMGGLPPYADWAMLEVRNADGRLLRMKSPAARTTEEARFVNEEGEPAVGLFLIVADDASTSVRAAARVAQQLVVGPKSVRVYTSLPEPAIAKVGVLRSKVNGRGAGQFLPAELASLVRAPEPGRPQHEGGYAVSDLVALRAGGATVTAVDVVAKDDQTITLRPGEPGWSEAVLKPNKKGDWVFKRPAPDAPNPRERGGTLRSVQLIAIRTATSP